MKSRSNPLVTQYLKDVSAKIVCPKGTKRFFLCELEQEVLAFAEEKPDLTMEMICQAFGVPEKYASNIADQECYIELYQKATKKAKIWKWVGIGIAALLAALLIWCIYILYLSSGNVNVTNPQNNGDVIVTKPHLN